MEYITVKDFGTDSFIEKKSEFIGYCKPVKTEEEAKLFINEIKVKNKDASHNVWAYSLREGNIMRYNDDGEPQGTAGIPVLEVLKKSETIDAVMVVTRYYGGIMLGAGGLIRAYSHGASIALKAAVPVVMKNCIMASFKCDYNYYNKLSDYFYKYNVVLIDTIFEDSVTVEFYLLPEYKEDLTADFADLTNGKGVFVELGKKFLGFEKK